MTSVLMLFCFVMGFAGGVWAALAAYHGAMAEHHKRMTEILSLHHRPLTREDVDMSIAVMDRQMDRLRVRDAAMFVLPTPDERTDR